MTTYTENQLAARVLKDLGLVGSTETATADDLAWAIETVAAEVAMLGAIGLPIWNGSVMAVPLEYLTPLSRRIGLAVAPSYGLMSMDAAQMAMREAERYLTVMAAPRGPMTLRADDARRGRAGFNYTTGQ